MFDVRGRKREKGEGERGSERKKLCHAERHREINSENLEASDKTGGENLNDTPNR